jgi:spore germination cell wall hydrolase CwlJ-like protein
MTIFVLAYTIKVDIDSNNARELALLEVAKLANKSIKTVNTEHLKCLATNIYHEARSEPFMGQVAVARVVMNRIKHGFASNPCRVVYQYTTVPDLNSEDGTKKLCQFSWVCEGKSTPNSNNPMYKQAEYIANKVLAENKWNDIVPSNVLFFHNHSVNPNWNHHKFMVIGNHIFYSKNNK